MVFKLTSAGEGTLKYSAKLESGSATVYYDFLGSKSELFSVHSGDEVDSFGGYVDRGTVYIIVETNGECQMLPPSHSVIQKALYNVTQARVMSGKRHSKMSRKQKLPGKQKR